jgi:hypothetical protein
MQFPRYELVLPSERERVPSAPRPRPRRVRPWRRPSQLRREMHSQHRASRQMDVQQYLALEFTVDDRR